MFLAFLFLLAQDPNFFLVLANGDRLPVLEMEYQGDKVQFKDLNGEFYSIHSNLVQRSYKAQPNRVVQANPTIKRRQFTAQFMDLPTPEDPIMINSKNLKHFIKTHTFHSTSLEIESKASSNGPSAGDQLAQQERLNKAYGDRIAAIHKRKHSLVNREKELKKMLFMERSFQARDKIKNELSSLRNTKARMLRELQALKLQAIRKGAKIRNSTS